MAASDTLLNCASCGQQKSCTEFSPRKSRPRGYHYSCKVCLASRAKGWRKTKVYTDEERLIAKERSDAWRKENPLQNKQIKKRWAKLNPHIKLASHARRRSIKNNSTPPWLNVEHKQVIEQLFWLAKDLRAVSGEDYHVDHIVPLQNPLVCGLHVPWNLQVLPRDLNLSKKNKFEVDYERA